MAEKRVVALVGMKTPPLSADARVAIGGLLRQLQEGQRIPMPHSRPMPSIDNKCHELRVSDGRKGKSWRLFYLIEEDAIVVVELVAKKSEKTPKSVIDRCVKRIREYRNG